MAGAGRRTFVPGEVLTASNVNSYLMDQAVMVFDDATERDVALGTAVVSEGMVSYLKDTDTVERFDGSSWVVPFSVANGGTGATTVAAAQDSLRVGLVPISPSGVAAVGGGTATVNTLGQVSFLDTPKVQLADVFSSAYRNYRVLLTASTGTNVGVSFRLFTGSIASPPSEAITNYSWTLTQNNGSAITVNAASSQSNAFVGSSAGQTAAAYDIFNPNVNRLTRLVGQTYGFSTNDTTYFGGAFHNAAFQATGLSFFTTNGTNMEGNIQVFGYND